MRFSRGKYWEYLGRESTAGNRSCIFMELAIPLANPCCFPECFLICLTTLESKIAHFITHHFSFFSTSTMCQSISRLKLQSRQLDAAVLPASQEPLRIYSEEVRLWRSFDVTMCLKDFGSSPKLWTQVWQNIEVGETKVSGAESGAIRCGI